MTSFVYGHNVPVSPVTLAVTRHDDSGTATAETIVLAGWNLNVAAIGPGSGGGETLMGGADNDLVLWDDRTQSADASTVFGAGRYGLPAGSGDAAIDAFDLGAGNDVVNLTHSAAAGGAVYAHDAAIFGGAGDDVAWSSVGDDSVEGGQGNDRLFGGGGDDRVWGGAAADTLYGGSGEDELDGGEGLDLVYGGDGADEAKGGADDDRLFGGDGGDELQGDSGDDTLEGGAGADALEGNSGSDLASYAGSSSGVVVFLGGDDDVGTASGGDGAGDTLRGIERIRGSAFDDTVFGVADGRPLDAVFYAYEGGAGRDLLDFSASDRGLDVAVGGGWGRSMVVPGAALDPDVALNSNAGFETVAGSDFADGIAGFSGADTIFGGGGDDVLRGDETLGGGRVWRVDGASGTGLTFVGLDPDGDAIMRVRYDGAGGQGEVVRVVVAANSAANVEVDRMALDLRAGETAFLNFGAIAGVSVFTWTIEGVAVGGTATASSTSAQRYIAIGDDYLAGGAGADSLFGGGGADRLEFGRDFSSGTAQTVRVLAADGEGAAVTLLSSGIDRAWSNDRFDGGDSPAASGGQAALDTLLGSGGADIILRDTRDLQVGGSVVGGAQGDRLLRIEVVLAGAGADIIALNAATASADWVQAATLVGGPGDDTVLAGDGGDTLVGDDTVAGPSPGGADDVLYGGAGNDVLWGDDLGVESGASGDGGDTLYGGSGDDMLYGGGGDDTLYGGGGVDLLFGGDGENAIFLSADDPDGTIVFQGGAGDDVGLFEGAYDVVTFLGGAGDDLFVGGRFGGSAGMTDIVIGGVGNDAIAAYDGDDTLYGGEGDDFIWDGQGADTLYGGEGLDFLYSGGIDQTFAAADPADQLYGAGGDDYFYVGAGTRARLFDDGTEGDRLVVFGRFDLTGAQLFAPGTGVSDAPARLGQELGAGVGGDVGAVYAADPSSPGDFLVTLSVSGGVEADDAQILFSTSDVRSLVLWNSDNTVPGATQELYLWDPAAQAFVFAGYEG